MIWGNRVLTRGRCSTKIYGSPAHITASSYWCNHRWSLIYLTTSGLFCPTLFDLDYILQLTLTSHNFRIQWTAWAVSQYAHMNIDTISVKQNVLQDFGPSLEVNVLKELPWLKLPPACLLSTNGSKLLNPGLWWEDDFIQDRLML